MAFYALGRCAGVTFVIALLAGCGSSNPGGSGSSAALVRSEECLRNRSQCIYEGSYEKGERAYAEEQARRLNRAQSARLRRGF